MSAANSEDEEEEGQPVVLHRILYRISAVETVSSKPIEDSRLKDGSPLEINSELANITAENGDNVTQLQHNPLNQQFDINSINAQSTKTDSAEQIKPHTDGEEDHVSESYNSRLIISGLNDEGKLIVERILSEGQEQYVESRKLGEIFSVIQNPETSADETGKFASEELGNPILEPKSEFLEEEARVIPLVAGLNADGESMIQGMMRESDSQSEISVLMNQAVEECEKGVLEEDLKVEESSKQKVAQVIEQKDLVELKTQAPPNNGQSEQVDKPVERTHEKEFSGDKSTQSEENSKQSAASEYSIDISQASSDVETLKQLDKPVEEMHTKELQEETAIQQTIIGSLEISPAPNAECEADADIPKPHFDSTPAKLMEFVKIISGVTIENNEVISGYTHFSCPLENIQGSSDEEKTDTDLTGKSIEVVSTVKNASEDSYKNMNEMNVENLRISSQTTEESQIHDLALNISSAMEDIASAGMEEQQHDGHILLDSTTDNKDLSSFEVDNIPMRGDSV